MKIILLLGDQLSESISSLKDLNVTEDIILICETFQDLSDVKHHKKKLTFLLSARRSFSEKLMARGINVHYVKLDDPGNSQTIIGEVLNASKVFCSNKIHVTSPSSFKLLKEMKGWSNKFNLSVTILEDNRFLCNTNYFKKWANGKKQLRLEFFYRDMRKKYNILMECGKPEGGKWNYDIENRHVPKSKLNIPKPYNAPSNTLVNDISELVNKHFKNNFGKIEPFNYAINSDEAWQAFEKFVAERLTLFGKYQDAMIENEPWMYHSHIALYLNSGLLLPLECINYVENQYKLNNLPLNSVEGFIRQILGWREYIRGIYWLKMPEYENLNYLNASEPLPDFYWTGKTKMNCIKQCVKETAENAYAHHIQRLMVLGNFALLLGVSPKKINEWFLIVYADAYQWVELPNVSGMVLFADGGLVASKPYASSGAYINRMSNYCKKCEYDVRQKNGSLACPFNYLYWNFMIKNKNLLEINQRLKLVYNRINLFDSDKLEKIKSDSQLFKTEMLENE